MKNDLERHPHDLPPSKIYLIKNDNKKKLSIICRDLDDRYVYKKLFFPAYSTLIIYFFDSRMSILLDQISGLRDGSEIYSITGEQLLCGLSEWGIDNYFFCAEYLVFVDADYIMINNFLDLVGVKTTDFIYIINKEIDRVLLYYFYDISTAFNIYNYLNDWGFIVYHYNHNENSFWQGFVNQVNGYSLDQPIVPFWTEEQTEKIRQKKDKRTTFMIRNLPNKYTQSTLLELLNESHFGEFDFLYLRIDYENKCNVGYAFINFINTEYFFLIIHSAVLKFIDLRVGKKWPMWNSEKTCDLSYANIQGLEALVYKVLKMSESYRPLVFYTEGENKGKKIDILDYIK